MKNYFNSYLDSFNKLTLEVNSSNLIDAANIILSTNKSKNKIIIDASSTGNL